MKIKLENHSNNTKINNPQVNQIDKKIAVKSAKWLKKSKNKRLSISIFLTIRLLVMLGKINSKEEE